MCKPSRSTVISTSFLLVSYQLLIMSTYFTFSENGMRNPDNVLISKTSRTNIKSKVLRINQILSNVCKKCKWFVLNWKRIGTKGKLKAKRIWFHWCFVYLKSYEWSLLESALKAEGHSVMILTVEAPRKTVVARNSVTSILLLLLACHFMKLSVTPWPSSWFQEK